MGDRLGAQGDRQTVKRGWGLTHFLTRGLTSVKIEIALTFSAYNMLRVINILGVKEIMKRLRSDFFFPNLFRLHINNNWVTNAL